MTNQEYKATYWNEKGKYQKLYDKLLDKLVPYRGMSKTTTGEALRCLSRIYYERHNNGDCNDKTYEYTYLNEWLYDQKLKGELSNSIKKHLEEILHPSCDSSHDDDDDDEPEYYPMTDEELDQLIDIVVPHISKLLKIK